MMPFLSVTYCLGHLLQHRSNPSTHKPNSKILIIGPTTISCMTSHLEQHMILRDDFFMRVLNVRFLLSIRLSVFFADYMRTSGQFALICPPVVSIKQLLHSVLRQRYFQKLYSTSEMPDWRDGFSPIKARPTMRTHSGTQGGRNEEWRKIDRQDGVEWG